MLRQPDEHSFEAMIYETACTSDVPVTATAAQQHELEQRLDAVESCAVHL